MFVVKMGKKEKNTKQITWDEGEGEEWKCFIRIYWKSHRSLQHIFHSSRIRHDDVVLHTS